MKKVFLALGVVAMLGAVSCSVDTSGLDELNKELDKMEKEADKAEADAKCDGGDAKCDGGH